MFAICGVRGTCGMCLCDTCNARDVCVGVCDVWRVMRDVCASVV